MFPHELIKINIKIELTANFYNYLSHALFHLLNTLAHTLKYIFIMEEVYITPSAIKPRLLNPPKLQNRLLYP